MMKGCKTRAVFLCSGLVVALLPGVAGAHGNTGGSGFLSGLNHPVFGLDHLIAMVTVGLLSAQMGGRALWGVPAAFVSLMAVGAALGMGGVRLPFVEYGIAMSVVALGSALLVARKMPVAVAIVFVGAFAIFHGHAHGSEMPYLAEPALYAAGFSLATAVLHVFGAVTGYFLLHYEGGKKILRLTGLLIAASGVYFVAQV